MNVYGVTGWKNGGKTGLMERLISHFVARGLRVSTIKHAHHSFDVDHPGTDSHRHRVAGASEVVLASARRAARMTELAEGEEPSLAALLAGLGPCDLVLVEGYKRDSHPKIEAFRAAPGNPLIAPGDPTVRAVASDVPLEIDRPVFDLNDTASIADFIARDLGLDEEPEARQAPDESGGLKPPPLTNDCFALPRGVSWTPVDEALAHLRAGLHPVTAVETVPLSAASGRVLAEEITARRANPPHPNTAVDGYGFAVASLPGTEEVVLPLVPGRAAAGAPFAGAVPAGHAVRVLTGALLPEGVDTVVLEEDTRTDGARLAFRLPVKPGANTRPAGEDMQAGAPCLQAGRLLTPADLALAAATGHGALPVRETLRVGVLSTGDEIVAPGTAARVSQTYDANRPMLLALLARFGHEAVDLGHVGDDRAALRARLDGADVDAVLTSGGASAGDEDHVSALLREAGALNDWRIALKPGRPLALGLWNRQTPVFGLPGNPVAAFVCTLIFARPALALLAGADWSEPQGFDVPAGFSKRKKPGRREYLRARIRDGRAEVFRSEGSGRVSGLSWAEGLVELPDGAMIVEPGVPVRYIPFGSFGL